MLRELRVVAVAAVVALLAVSSCVAAESIDQRAVDFRVSIRHIDVHRGTLVYDLQPGGLTISLEDASGTLGKELCSSGLSAAQAAEWRRFLASFPLEKLALEYVDPLVDDALTGVTFSVRRPGTVARTIRVVASHQDDLAALCRRVKALVPEGCVPWSLYCE